MKRLVGAQVHEQRALAERTCEARRHIARGNNKVARLDRGEDTVDVVEEIEPLEALEPPTARGELRALLSRVAVLQVHEPQVVALRERHERRERRRLLALQVV